VLAAENVNRCFGRIELAALLAEKTSNISEVFVSRPSLCRDKLKCALKREFEGPGLETLRKSSCYLYPNVA